MDALGWLVLVPNGPRKVTRLVNKLHGLFFQNVYGSTESGSTKLAHDEAMREGSKHDSKTNYFLSRRLCDKSLT